MGTLTRPDGLYIGRKVTIVDSGSPRVYEVAGYHESGDIMLSSDGVINTSRKFKPERLELLPMEKSRPESPAAKAASDYAGGSAVVCTQDEAVEWLAFVMLQASSLFERIPSPTIEQDGDGAAVTGFADDNARAELKRLLTVRGESETGPVVTAALAYYDAALKWYQDDAVKYDD